MTAETAYNVFQALSPQEKERMLSMLNQTATKPKKEVQSKPDSYYREIILSKFSNWNKTRALCIQ